jgi:peptidoglycan-N-acetylglucosamine deacetylase
VTPSRDIDDWFHIVEVASHSYWHRMVYELSEDEFREDMQQSIDVRENASGTKILGFCAPSFSITPGCEWAFDVLLLLGLKYDAGISNTA